MAAGRGLLPAAGAGAVACMAVAAAGMQGTLLCRTTTSITSLTTSRTKSHLSSRAAAAAAVPLNLPGQQRLLPHQLWYQHQQQMTGQLRQQAAAHVDCQRWCGR
jgi:hypothetical protein